MPDTNEYPDLPDLHLGNVAPAICHKLKVPGCMVLLMGTDGTISMAGYGMNHAKANELLSVGIHLNLSQHDELVRAGAAGPAAQKIAEEIAAGNSGSEVQK